MPDEIQIPIGGDLSDFESVLSQLPNLAQEAASSVNSALAQTGGSDALTSSIQATLSSLGHLTPAAQQVASAFAAYQSAVVDATSGTVSQEQAAQQITATFTELSGAVASYNAQSRETEQQAGESGSAIGHLGETVEGLRVAAEAFIAVGLVETLREVAGEAVKAYGEQERLQTSLTLMGGSAGAAAAQIEKIDEMSVKLGIDQEVLEKSAQRLSAVFGVGEGLTGVMEAAANVSAVTGQSFDATAAALGRVEQTGTVSARQLVALGLTWQDLAHAMGTSIDEAQKALKKGGQDAAADLDVLLAAIKTKFGDAAAEQAKGVLGQFQSLKSQIQIVMEDLGSAIAPAVASVVSLLRSSVIPAVSSAIDEFKALPQPVREFILAAGVAAATVIPLIAALAAAGFALQGLNTLLGIAGISFGATAASAEALTIAETEASLATTAMAVAAPQAAVATEAAAAAQIGFGSAVSTATSALSRLAPLLQVAAYVVLAEKVWELARAYQGLRDAQQNLQAAQQTEQDSLSKLEIYLRQQGVDIGNLSDRYSSGLIPLEEYKRGLLDLAKTFRDANPYVEDAAAKQDRFAEAVKKALDEVVTKQEEANQKWLVAKQVLADLQEKYAGQADKSALLARATAAVKEAADAAHPSIKALADDFSTLAAKSSQQQQAFQIAQKAYQDAMAAFASGKTTMDVVNDAWTQLQSKAKAAGQAVYDVWQTSLSAVEKASSQIGTIKNLADAYLDLTQYAGDSVVAQQALADIFKQLETAGKNVGISISQVGGSLDFELADKAGKASTGVQALVDQLTDLYGSSKLVYVEVNGKLVPTLESIASASQDASDKLGTLDKTIVKVKDSATGLNATVTVLKASVTASSNEIDGLDKVAAHSTATFGSTSEALGNLAERTAGTTDRFSQAYVALSGQEIAARAAKEAYAALKDKIQVVGPALDQTSSAMTKTREAFESTSGAMEHLDSSITGGIGQFTDLGTAASASGSTIVGVASDFSTAQSAVTAVGTSVSGTSNDLSDGIQPADDYARSLDGISSAASAAASAISSVGTAASSTPDWATAPMGSEGLNGQKTSVVGYLGQLYAAGALPSQIGAAAQGLGYAVTNSNPFALTVESWADLLSASSNAIKTNTAAVAASTSAIAKATAAYTGTIADAQKAYDDTLAAYRAGTGSLNDFLTAAENLNQAADTQIAKYGNLTNATQKAADAASSLTTATTTAASTISSTIGSIATATDAAIQVASAAADSVAANAKATQAITQAAEAQINALVGGSVSTAGVPASAYQAMGTGSLYTLTQHFTTSAGVLVGNNGMQQLSQMVAQIVVEQLKQNVGLKI